MIRYTPGGVTKFGYYIDIKREFGVERITRQLRDKLKEIFTGLRFKDISFDECGGMSLHVDVNDSITFVSA